jgi:hypothetical protein
MRPIQAVPLPGRKNRIQAPFGVWYLDEILLPGSIIFF